MCAVVAVAHLLAGLQGRIGRSWSERWALLASTCFRLIAAAVSMLPLALLACFATGPSFVSTIQCPGEHSKLITGAVADQGCRVRKRKHKQYFTPVETSLW